MDKLTARAEQKEWEADLVLEYLASEFWRKPFDGE